MGNTISWFASSLGFNYTLVDSRYVVDRRTVDIFEPGTYTKMDKVLKDGLPQMTFKKVSSPSSKHTSGHEPIEEEITNQSFGILDNLESQWCAQPERLISGFLNMPVKYVVTYSSEAQIQNLVGSFLGDLLIAAGLGAKLVLLAEGSICGRKDGGQMNRADYWLVVHATGKPIMVVEVKSPDVVGILNDPSVMGQTCDYMIDAQSFFGFEDIFGISTNLKEWKFLWFPHSDERAKSTHVACAMPTSPVPGLKLSTARRLHSTRVYHHTEPEVGRIIISMFHKSLRSRYTTVPLFSSERMYVQLSESTWVWRRMDDAAVSNYQQCVSIELTGNTKKCSAFTVLKYMYRLDRAPRVWLTVAGAKPPTLVVLKQVDRKEKLAVELRCWRELNGVTHAFSTTVDGTTALCMPLVIHAREAGGGVRFEFDLCKWTAPDTVVADPVPAPLLRINQQLHALVERNPQLRDPIHVLRLAIENTGTRWISGTGTRNGYVEHSDLQWRHVALLPICQEHNVVDLKPILIDFGRVTMHESSEDALSAMRARADQMQRELLVNQD